MYLTGHTGLTLGIASLLNRGHAPMSYKRIFLVMVFALMPDILDRGLHMTIPGYPDHAIFHSLFLYAVLLILAAIFMRRLLPYPAIMAMNVLFDVVNVDPRVFVYPLFGWCRPFHGKAMPVVIKPLIQYWPEVMKYRFPAGHYLLFEAGGLFLIVWIVLNKIAAGPFPVHIEGKEPQVQLAEDLAD